MVLRPRGRGRVGRRRHLMEDRPGSLDGLFVFRALANPVESEMEYEDARWHFAKQPLKQSGSGIGEIPIPD